MPADIEHAAALAEVAQLRDRILNVVGHALATPVATLRGLIGTLDADLPDDRRADVVAALRRVGAHLETLVDDVLVASGVDTRIPPELPAPTEVRGVIERVWAMVGGDGPLEVAGEATAMVSEPLLVWMLRPALDNLVRYGDDPRTVTIASAAGRVQVALANGGAALGDRDVTNAFELFYRGEDAVMRVGARLGVGLTVMRTLAERAGAVVALTAREGGGAIVTIDLPGT